DALAHTIQPDDLATIIYTSGTTGTPKGAMLTHGNITSNMAFSLGGFDLSNKDVGISFLPLSHVTARHLDYCLFMHGVQIAYCPFIEDLSGMLLEARPTILVAVPRVYEKVREKVETKTARGIKNKIYRWALGVGREHIDEVTMLKRPTDWRWRLADLLLYRNVRAGFGGRVYGFLSGGAPLGPDLARWYASVGIAIHEGYGLTETSPVIALNKPGENRLGTVGKVLKNVECKIADDGEILVKGPSVFKGYWNRPEETLDAFTHDGWFKTGDIARLDADGYLIITDRKKDLIKTSGGKFIAPQPIEG